MGVYIKGMKMPSCNDCPLAGDFKCNLMPSIPALCKEYDIAVQNGKRLDNCPLVELPPHGRLIDADELRWFYDNSDVADDVITKENYDQLKVAVAVVRQTIEDAPTIIEVEEGE